MARVLRFVGPVVVVLIVATRALAQDGGSSERPTGFSIEVGLAASTSVYTADVFDAVVPGVSFAPRLGVGAQLGRLSLALTTSLSVVGQSYEDADGDEVGYNLWTVRLGPYVDGEVWSSGRVALFVYGGVDVLVYRNTDAGGDGDDTGATGFALDLGLGGRVYVLPQFPIALKLGTAFEMAFWDSPSAFGDVEMHSQSWSIYGALAFRFVTAR